MDQRVLGWFGQVEKIGEYRMAERVLIAEVEGGHWVRLDGRFEGGFGQQRDVYLALHDCPSLIEGECHGILLL